jgi:hypothetical protein
MDKLQVPFNTVRSSHSNPVCVKNGSEWLARYRIIKTIKDFGLGCTPGKGGLDETLEIDRETRLERAQMDPRSFQVTDAMPAKRDQFVNVRIAFEQRHPLRRDKPGKAPFGETLL